MGRETHLKAPVSVCIICDDDPHLAKAVESVEPWVAEVVTLSPKDVPGAYDASGRIADFSAARNASFKLATQPWVMWLDSDDTLANGEQLAELCKAPPGTCYMLPYEYAYDQVGRCVVRQYRERLFQPRGAMHWLYPVHEVMVPVGPALHMVQSDAVTVKHQRQFNPKPQEPGRNLRILERWMKDHPDDVRNQFYLGLELSNANRLDEAISWLRKYVGTTGWPDEKAQALSKLVEIHERRGQFQMALDWAFEMLKVCDWFESCYAICRQFYHLKEWQRCVHYARMALNAPPTKTVLFTNEADRHELHVYLNVALNQLGKTQEAYESTLEGLKGNADHPLLRHNRTQYEKALQGGWERNEKALQGGAPVARQTHYLEAAGSTPAPATDGLVVKTAASAPSVTSPLIAENAGSPAPIDYDPKRLDIVFVTASWERWDPESIKATGIGGSETMLANMARELAKLGHKVTVYADPTKEGTYDGAEWRNKERFSPSIECDVLVVSRQAQFLDAQGVQGRVRLLWCHDVTAIGATPARLLRADRLLGLSNWHRDFLVRAHDIHPDQVIVTRNGIDLERFKASPPRNPYKIVNSSSPDRSWPVLLDCFARIRERVPQAELHLFYGMENWRKVAQGDKLQTECIDALEQRVRTQPGVHYHGRVSQERLTQEFLTAGLWAYPTWFTETSCITAMEAQAAGLRIVTSNIAALTETVGDAGKLLDGEWTSAGYQDNFVGSCVAAITRMSRPELADTWPKKSVAERFALPTLALEWQSMFLELLEQKKTHPLNPYHPTKPYRAEKVSPRTNATVKLNIACGPNIFPYPGWTNYDKADFSHYWRFLRTGERLEMSPQQKAVTRFVCDQFPHTEPVTGHDMTIPFPHEDNSVDYIYVGQAIEHMNRRTQVIPFLQECRRMLKPGGVLRMTTPDLQALVAAYLDVDFDKYDADQPAWFKGCSRGDKLSYLMFGAAGPECTQGKYEGHFHLYTPDSMEEALLESGFSAIAFGRPPHPEVKDEGMSHSFAVEATK